MLVSPVKRLLDVMKGEGCGADDLVLARHLRVVGRARHRLQPDPDFLGGLPRPDLTAAGQMLDALFVSVLFDAAYAIAYGIISLTALRLPSLQQITAHYPVVGGGAVLLLFLLVPAALSALRYRLAWTATKQGPAWLRRPTFSRSYRATPSGWDYNALTNTSQPSFVRVRLAEEVWVGGWFATKSFMSTYPVAPDLFIESAWQMDADGEFLSPVTGSRGVWVALPPGTVVEWVQAPSAQDEGESDGEAAE